MPTRLPLIPEWWLLAGLYLTTLYPGWCAWQANRSTTLGHALAWAGLAWVGWAGVLGAVLLGHEGEELDFFRLLALALTSGAVVAVLGARRPGWRAWNLVVLGLLAVLLLPLTEQLLVGKQAFGPVRMLFLLSTGLVGLVNYLPTRLGPAAFLLALSYGQQLHALWTSGSIGLADEAAWLSLSLAPWLGWFCLRYGPTPASDFDCTWLDFRDRFGLFWGLRLREQFQHAARHAGWPLTLHWWGLEYKSAPCSAVVPDPLEKEAQRLLKALLRRFRLPGTESNPDASS